MPDAVYVKSQYRDLQASAVLRAPVTALIGVSAAAAARLRDIAIRTVFDLATSALFAGARRVAHPSPAEDLLRAEGLIPNQLLNAPVGDGSGTHARADLADLPVTLLHGVDAGIADALRNDLGVETIGDLAEWPPFRAALAIAGLEEKPVAQFADPEIPDELVPKLNEHATEKTFYCVYTLDPAGGGRLPALDEEIDLSDALRTMRPDVPRTGAILRYEQSWTPVALSLGNLLHSLALAPGESARIAMVDWSRRQGVRTVEDVSQLESLANATLQNRSINEVTRAIAREAQTGFSNINANSTVSNSAYTSYGLQNAGEVMDATVNGALFGAGAGATAGGVAGAGIGGVAGAIIGGVALSETVVGIPGGIAVGGLIGAAGGGAIGAGAGGMVGGTAGGTVGFLGAAQFGSAVDSGSSTTLDVVTATSSTGTRDIEAEMLQNIADRTHQHSSSSRNRRASIVQEVSQSETERVSTRVVTNYNHMHALTIQYFEVVQQYAVRTTLVSRQRCLYVPIKPIERWSAELLNRYRNEILSVALTPDIAYALMTAMSTVTVSSPTYPRIPSERLRNADRTLLSQARQKVDAFVSADPLNAWRLPDSLYLGWVFGVMGTGGAGPFGGVGGPNATELTHRLMAVLRSGERTELKLAELEQRRVRLSEIVRIDYVIRPHGNVDWDLAAELAQPAYGSMSFLFRLKEGSWEEDPDNTITFHAHFTYSAEDVFDRELTIPILTFSHAQSLASVIAHLNTNSAHYSSRILRSRRNPALRRILSAHAWRGKPLLDVVDQDPIAVSGQSLVFLLHDEPAQALRTRNDPKPRAGSIRSEEIIPVGTGGVFAEAVQGRANAAERLDLGRFWDWQDSPIPIVAPEIAPVVLGSRAMAADVRPGSLDAALLQNLALRGQPDPQGVAAALGAVSKEMFRDMSGIAAAAQVAQTSLQEAMSGATATGQAASENLRAGMEQTHAVLKQIVDANSKFAMLLAEQGFGLLTDAAKGALGSALGTGGATLPSAGGAVPVGALMSGGAGGSKPPAGSALAQRNASLAGAVLNRAADRTRASPGGQDIAGDPRFAPSLPGGGGANASATGSASGAYPHAAAHDDLEGRIIGELGGVPSSSGPTPAAAAGPFGGGASAHRIGSVDDVIRTRLLPLLAGASDSDAAFFAALRTTLDLAAEVQASGQDDGPVRRAALVRLIPAWNAAVDRAVADFNAGDGAAIHRLDQLLAAQAQWSEIAGPTTPSDVIGRLEAAILIEDITAPARVEGGEMVTVGARIMLRLPDGSTRPAEGAPVHLVAYPSVEEHMSAVANQDGRVSFTLRHGVPDPSYAGVHRFTGFLDLELHLSASAPFSVLINDSVKRVVPGVVKITLEHAYNEDDGATALIGSIVHAHVGRMVLLNFRATKAGQALQSYPVQEISINGAGAADATTTDAQGAFTVRYLAAIGSGTTAYLSAVLATSAADTAAGMATIAIL